jgi:hypothetical protein
MSDKKSLEKASQVSTICIKPRAFASVGTRSVVPIMNGDHVILLGSTSGCFTITAKAFFASCFRSLNVTFPHTLQNLMILS